MLVQGLWVDVCGCFSDCHFLHSDILNPPRNNRYLQQLENENTKPFPIISRAINLNDTFLVQSENSGTRSAEVLVSTNSLYFIRTRIFNTWILHFPKGYTIY